jgi:hypothetical protein
MKKCQMYRPEYGTKPMASNFDHQWDSKLEKAIQEGKLDPIGNYEHHLKLLTALVMKTFCLRGAKEPSYLTKDDFIWSEKTVGKYAGLKCVRLKPSHQGQKMKELSLANPNRIDDSNKDAHIEVVRLNDPLCLYELLHKQINVYMPPNCGGQPMNRILRRKAPKGVLDVSILRFAASHAPVSSLTNTPSV